MNRFLWSEKNEPKKKDCIMLAIAFIPRIEFVRTIESKGHRDEKLAVISDMCRANALAAVKLAGSGHLGSSFSSLDVVVKLYYDHMNISELGFEHPERDIFFSSKGHDVPGLYSVLHSLGVITEEKLLKLRKFGGLDGHPDTGVPGVESNSGSLGMGVSKGRGMAWAKKYRKLGGRVYVMTGDGELQEGQNFEAFQAAAHQKIDNLTVIVDNNKIQSDKRVSEILDLGDFTQKIKSFGWWVTRCDGHDYNQLGNAIEAAIKVEGIPQMILADTIKGRGVSFMEHPTALKIDDGYYRWHAGAPKDEFFHQGHEEILTRVNRVRNEWGLGPVELTPVKPIAKSSKYSMAGEPHSKGGFVQRTPLKFSAEYVADAFGKAILELAEIRTEFIVLDADLASDCRIRPFELKYPDRFIENGIAEQDMVSMAGGIAAQGLLPIVNSFASFLASRANEQIYNNATEGNRIIYACHYAGLIPAGPGKSHQSIRDISLFGALPNCIVLQPCNSLEAKMVMEFAVQEAKEQCMIRLVIGPSPTVISLPDSYELAYGQGVSLTNGSDALIFAYGPVMLHEALLAVDILKKQGRDVKVINMPWLNRVDRDWLATIVSEYIHLYVIEDHAPVGGLGDYLLSELNHLKILDSKRLRKLGVEGFPACGTPNEALRFHRLDGASLAEVIHGDLR